MTHAFSRHPFNPRDRRITSTERILASLLRSNGFRFWRQDNVLGYVVDFHLPHKLVVEVDGKVHETLAQKRDDEHRDALLSKHGYTVLRLQNSMIREYPAKSLQLLRNATAVAKAKSISSVKASHASPLVPFRRLEVKRLSYECPERHTTWKGYEDTCPRCKTGGVLRWTH